LYRKRTTPDYDLVIAIAFQMFKRLAPNLAMNADNQIEPHVLEFLPNRYRPGFSLQRTNDYQNPWTGCWHRHLSFHLFNCPV
jgi:hypothetical protein